MPVPLARGRGFAWVDQQDHEACLAFKWFETPRPARPTPYAQRNLPKHVGQKTGTQRLHRFIAQRMGIGACPEVDHEDRNGLNCTRRNLRPSNRSQNSANRAPQKSNTSGFKGVSWSRKEAAWAAQIWENGRHFRVGFFESSESAARVYDEWAKAAFGDFSWLNFPWSR